MRRNKDLMSNLDQPPLQFPCTFPIKAMGLASGTFASVVVGIVRRHVQLDAIYQDLVACEQVLMAL